nr:RNA polymerase sigma factor [uncultured Chitinophaga sp.]
MEGCRRNDRLSQEKLYNLFFDRQLSMIRRYTSDRDKAVDILNNGFLRAFKKIGDYSHTGSFEGWLRRIMIHAIADYFRSAQAQIKAQAVGEIPEYAHYTDDNNQLEYKELLLVLQQLPPTTRVVINLFIIEGYAHKEIASLLNISSGTSKWHVAEGKRILKEQLLAQRSFDNNKPV